MPTFDFLVAGNVNLETRLRVGSFPVDYEKLRFAPGGITDEVSGVGLNVSAALGALGHSVALATVLVLIVIPCLLSIHEDLAARLRPGDQILADEKASPGPVD